MSKVVDMDSGPKIEIKIEETAIAGTSALSTPSREGDADVKYEDAEKS